MGITETVEHATPTPFIAGRGLPMWFVWFVMALSLLLLAGGLGFAGWWLVFGSSASLAFPLAFAAIGATCALVTHVAFFEDGWPTPSPAEDGVGGGR